MPLLLSMANDKRKFLRFELPVNVKLTTLNGTELILKSQDISDSGVFLRANNAELPKVGEQVVIQLASMVDGDEPKEINAKVVRHNEQGIGIEFLLDSDVSD